MKNQEQNEFIAPEQYELQAPPAYKFAISRRTFFNVLGSGVAVAFTISKSIASAITDEEATPEDQVSAWIHVGENGIVTVYTGKAEVGQNIRTSLAQIVCEELNVSIERIQMVMGDTALTPYDRGTFGSRSIPYMGPQLRKAAATARELLLDMAAEKWKADRTSLKIEKGIIQNQKTQQTIDIGQLSKGKELLKPVNDSVTMTPVEQWKITGKSVPKVNGESFITGSHKYVSDMKLPDMLYGKILRPPAYGATLTSIDLAEAKSIKGVTVVHDGDFVGVTAPDMITANRALNAIRAEWQFKPQPSRNGIFEYLKKNAQQSNGRDASAAGDVTSAFANAEIKVEQTFNVDYIAHAPLEPRAGLAKWEGNKLTVWTGTQRPFGVQEDLEEIFHIPKANIRVIQPDTGY